MSISPLDLLALAEELAGHESEVHHRSAVSRAYYAALHSAKAIEDTCPLVADDGRGGYHHQLFKRLTGPKAPTPAKRVGYMLVPLRAYRTKADYELSTQIEAESVKTIIEQVKRIQEILK